MTYTEFHKNVCQYMPLIRRKVAGIHQLSIIGYDHDDAVQDVFLYLWKYCFKNFDNSKGAKLSTYIQGGIWRAIDHIKKRIQRELVKNNNNYYFQLFDELLIHHGHNVE